MFSEQQRIELIRSHWENLEAEVKVRAAAVNEFWASPEFEAARDALQKARDAYEPLAQQWDEMYAEFKAAREAARRAGEVYRHELAGFKLAG